MKKDDTVTQELEQVVDKLDAKYFFFDLPLYEAVSTSDEIDRDSARALLNFSKEFDAYSYTLKENSTFVGYDNQYNVQSELQDQYRLIDVTLRCKRAGNQYHFYIWANKNKVMKVGQYPSLADINIGLIKEYSDVLSGEKLKEFIRGIGLRAHGVGIGSFVYLRRIFEYLIEQEHLAIKKEKDWEEDLYKKSRMVEKIGLLSAYLPDFLVENKDLYGILSLGVHELSEEECLKYFDALKMGIEEILEEKVIEEQKKKRRQKVKKSLTDIRTSIANKSNTN